MIGGWVGLLLCLLASVSQAAVPLEALDETAQQFAVECASASSLSPGTATLHVAEFEPYIHSPSLEPAQALFRDVLLKHLLEQRYFTLLEGPDAAATARYLLKGKLVESDGALIVSVNLLEPGMQRILVAAQRPIRVDIPSPVTMPVSVAEASPTVKAVLSIPPKKGLRTGRGQWWAHGGAGYRGRDLAWSVSGSYRPVNCFWETGLEYGQFKHKDTVDSFRPGGGSFSFRKISWIDVRYLRLNLAFVYPIDSIPVSFKTSRLKVKSSVKLGGGQGAYYIRDRYDFYLPDLWQHDADERHHWRVGPRFFGGFALGVGNYLELQVLGEYVVMPERFGFDYRIGGPGVMFQLGYRIR